MTFIAECLVYYLSRMMLYQFITFFDGMLGSSILASRHNRLSANVEFHVDEFSTTTNSNHESRMGMGYGPF